METVYLNTGRMVAEGLVFEKGSLERAEKALARIVALFIGSPYGFMQNDFEKGLEGDEKRAMGKGYRTLYDLGIVKTGAGLTAKNRAVSAVIQPNFASQFWSLQIADIIALGKKYRPVEIAERSLWFINFAMAREDFCFVTDKVRALDALMEEIKKEIDFEEELPLALVDEIFFFIKKRGDYNPELGQVSVSYEDVFDFFVRLGYKEENVVEVIGGLTQGCILEEDEDGLMLVLKCRSARDILCGL